jgi:type IV secretion system protein VirB10
MPIANDSIEGTEALPARPQARRPVIIVGVVFAIVGLLAVYMSNEASSGQAIKEEDEPFLLPDRTSAEGLRSEATNQPQASASASSSKGPARSENLGETNGVPQLPADALGPAALLEQQQHAQYDRYLLTVQAEALEARRRSLTSGLRIAAFDVARQQDFAEASALLGQLSGQANGGGGDLGGLAGLGSMGNLAQLGAAPALAALSGARGGAVGGGFGGDLGDTSGGMPDPNHTAAKKDFFMNGGAQLRPGQLAASVRRAAPYEVLMGTVIPGVLISGINSEAPGQIIGQVSEHVYDSATHKHLLVPQGSKLVGTYSATVAQGQARIQVAWVRLNFPNGDKLDLGGMSGADQAGTSGFSDQVDRHFMMRLAAALMTTALTVAYEITAPQGGNFYQSSVHRGVGESIVKLGTDMAQQEGQRPPTLKIRPGYRFLIHVSKDIPFERPYADGIERGPR